MGQAGRRIASADSFSASVNRCSGGAAAGGSSTGIAYLVRSVLAGRRRRERHCETDEGLKAGDVYLDGAALGAALDGRRRRGTHSTACRRSMYEVFIGPLGWRLARWRVCFCLSLNRAGWFVCTLLSCAVCIGRPTAPRAPLREPFVCASRPCRTDGAALASRHSPRGTRRDFERRRAAVVSQRALSDPKNSQ